VPATEITYSAITPVGDLWLHGGWIPVIVGMFLIGCGTRLLDDVMDVHANPHCIFLFLLLFPSLVKQEGDWTQTIVAIPSALLIWLFATYITFRKRNRTIAGRSPVSSAPAPRSPRTTESRSPQASRPSDPGRAVPDLRQ